VRKRWWHLLLFTSKSIPGPPLTFCAAPPSVSIQRGSHTQNLSVVFVALIDTDEVAKTKSKPLFQSSRAPFYFLVQHTTVSSAFLYVLVSATIILYQVRISPQKKFRKPCYISSLRACGNTLIHQTYTAHKIFSITK